MFLIMALKARIFVVWETVKLLKKGLSKVKALIT